ncbi:uncharacterized protein LOC131673229 [Phymastichus coffea]|uniref:uncharacterized protein LOC131673229 n=1 Tax=Phymastichus coffea TaxID=108790 RepID=UPI00273C01FD|nr:uncharacterized protein LOC131673229 [Phymastichus coffea]
MSEERVENLFSLDDASWQDALNEAIEALGEDIDLSEDEVFGLIGLPVQEAAVDEVVVEQPRTPSPRRRNDDDDIHEAATIRMPLTPPPSIFTHRTAPLQLPPPSPCSRSSSTVNVSDDDDDDVEMVCDCLASTTTTTTITTRDMRRPGDASRSTRDDDRHHNATTAALGELSFTTSDTRDVLPPTRTGRRSQQHHASMRGLGVRTLRRWSLQSAAAVGGITTAARQQAARRSERAGQTGGAKIIRITVEQSRRFPRCAPAFSVAVASSVE